MAISAISSSSGEGVRRAGPGAGAGQRRPMEQSTATMRDFTLEEAMSLAIRLHKNEQFAEADDVYRRILELVPDHPDVLHFSGILAHQQGRSDEAIALIERSLAIVPNQADCYSNLGNIFPARGRPEA